MPDYSKGQIYTIRNRNDNAKIYVGSTIQPLYKRFYSHKIDSQRYMNMLLYKEVNYDWTNWYIELYENCPCNSKTELEKREGEVIRLIGTLNCRIEGRDKKQYRIDNIEKIKEREKQYKINNADKIKQYNINNVDKIKEYDKQYYIENADKIKERKKQYYQNNADKIKEKQNQKYLEKKKNKH